jgi:phage-related baseplate assembly protein
VITDAVTTTSANVVSVNVEAEVYLYPDSSATVLAGIEAAIRAAIQTEGGLGWDLTLSWLIKNIHVDGVQRVELISPTTNQVADDGTAISIGTFTVTNLGYDR